MKKEFEGIKQSEARLRKIIPRSRGAGCRTVPWNSSTNDGATYTGLSPEEAHSWGWKVTIHLDDMEKLMDTWSKFEAGGGVVREVIDCPPECEELRRRHEILLPVE